MRTVIYISGPAESTPEQKLRQSWGAFTGLFTGLGLSIYQSVTHTWFMSFLPTSITLFFVACGLFLLYRIGWRGTLSPLEASDYNTLRTWGLTLAWVIALWVYLQSSFLGRVFDQDSKLRAYFSDPACSSGAMYKMAKTQPQGTPMNVLYPVPATAVCTVGWIQAERDGKVAAHPYARYFAGRDLYRGVHKGDMVVVQTAFGHLSAVLYPSRGLVDSLFFPRGAILETGYHPVRTFEGPFMENFWFLFFFLFIGSMVMLRLVASFRTWQSLGSLPT